MGRGRPTHRGVPPRGSPDACPPTAVARPRAPELRQPDHPGARQAATDAQQVPHPPDLTRTIRGLQRTTGKRGGHAKTAAGPEQRALPPVVPPHPTGTALVAGSRSRPRSGRGVPIGQMPPRWGSTVTAPLYGWLVAPPRDPPSVATRPGERARVTPSPPLTKSAHSSAAEVRQSLPASLEPETNRGKRTNKEQIERPPAPPSTSPPIMAISRAAQVQVMPCGCRSSRQRWRQGLARRTPPELCWTGGVVEHATTTAGFVQFPPRLMTSVS